MEGDAYGNQSTRTNLVSGNYPYRTIDSSMLSKDFMPSRNLDTGFQASRTNEPMEIAQLDDHTRNNGDGTPPPAKKRRGRPPGSKNKTKVDAALHAPKPPKPQRKARVSKQKAMSSPQIAPNVHGAVYQTNSGVPSQAGAATIIPTEGAMEFHPTNSHRKNCPCHDCCEKRPDDAKRTRSGAPFDLFASLAKEATAAVYKRHEESSHYMGSYAELSAAEFKAKQEGFVKDSLDNDPLFDRNNNPVTSILSRSTIMEHALETMEQKLQELKKRNKTFTADPPCVKKGEFRVQYYIEHGVGREDDVVDDSE